MNVLAVGSHPDDVEFGCAGTIHKLVDKGHRVYLLILTDGGAGGDSSVRRKEQGRSARLMKVHDLFWGSFLDTRLPRHEKIIQEIETVVNKIKPTFVFVHHGRDTHQDHRYVSESAVVATRNVPNVLFYEGPTTIDFAPHVYVDIGKYVNKKFKTLGCHASQIMKTNIQRQSIVDIAKATAIFRGTQCRVAYAEGFASLRMFVIQ